MSFSVKGYRCSADPKEVDKGRFMALRDEYVGVLKEATSIVNPTILVESERDDIPSFNYVYIPEFSRYYFVRDIVSVRNNLWEISMECDVLYTYKNAILNCKAFVDRCENGYNPMVIDNLLTIEDGLDISYEQVVNFIFDPKKGNVVLTGFTVGIKDKLE